MVNKTPLKAGNLSKGFIVANVAQYVIENCNVKSNRIVHDTLYVVDNTRIAPTDSQLRYGRQIDDLLVMAEANSPLLLPQKKRFVELQVAEFEQARDRTINAYEARFARARKSVMVEIEDEFEDSAEVEMMQLLDEDFKSQILMLISEKGYSAAAAIDKCYGDRIEEFENYDDSDISKRVVEWKQHRNALEHALHNKDVSSFETVPQGRIIANEEGIPLAAMASFIDPETGKLRVGGIITADGTDGSHAAIMARSMGIPYFIVSMEQFRRLRHGDDCILDGPNKKILGSPYDDAIAEITTKIETQAKTRKVLQSKWGAVKSVKTLDGEEINIQVNFALSPEAYLVRKANVTEIGLYRTEAVPPVRIRDPSVEHWTKIKETIMRKCAANEGEFMPITIRTLDVSGDKKVLGGDDNRAREDKIVSQQMEAALVLNDQLVRQGHHGKVKLMIPVIKSQDLKPDEDPRTSLAFMQERLDAIAEKKQLPTMILASMIETREALTQLQVLRSSYFSVGSNDLICDILQINRYEQDEMKKYDPTDSSVLDAFEQVTSVGKERDIPVGICGDIASQVKWMAVLAGCGFRAPSMGTDSVLELKEAYSRLDIREARQLVATLKTISGRAEREAYLAHWNETYLGLKSDGELQTNWKRPDDPTPEPRTA